MAVVNTKSTSVGNADATPKVLNDATLVAGLMHVTSDTLEVAAADDDTSTYRLLRLPTNAVLRQLLLYNDAITGGTSFDFGLYYTAGSLKAGVVVPSSAALFASAVDLSSAHAGTDITFEATATNIDSHADKALWDLAGLASDPGGHFDLVATANTVGSAAGTIRATAYWTLRG